MNGPAPGWEAPADSFAHMPGSELVLLLGGNLGDPSAELARAEAAIQQGIGPILARSRDHWTEAWGFSDPRPFLNKALLLELAGSPLHVLETCLGIELSLGRIRSADGSPAPRNIDIDILLVGEELIDLPGLKVPHPRLHLRRFALAPLSDLLPSWRHPLQGRTTLALLDSIPT